MWDGEKHMSNPVNFHVCFTHKEWMTHEGYIDNKDGTVSCVYCNWGFILPGYMRILDGKVFDLRQR